MATLPELSHALPTVPLCWALRAAGADVLVASGGDVVKVTEAGLPMADLLPGRGIADFLRAFDLSALAAPDGGPDADPPAQQGQAAQPRPAETPSARTGPAAPSPAPTPTPTPDPLAEAPSYAGFLPRVSELLPEADIAELFEMMHRFVALAEQWRPDVIVYGPMTVGALAAAAKLDVPAVEHGFGFLRTAGIDPLLRTLGSEVFDRHGVDLPASRYAIDVAPPSMLLEEPQGWPMRYIPYNGGARVPDWLSEPPSRPRVAVTLGNLIPELVRSGEHGVVGRIIDRADSVDAEFVLALGALDPGVLGKLPDNVRVIGYTPLTQLLPTCAAVVHHGGAGTCMGALDAGIPQLVIPHLFDHQHTADLVVKRGVGMALDLAVDPDLPASVLDALVGDEQLRGRAQEVRAEMRAMPTPVDVAARLFELVSA
ncbi:nucleotide disphospho-sugar-binding domain-containing protein [Pseudofrankia sp. EUN1h]|uniref:nucleotide disphospho-sugar-binding domain-containing protein n=1 Tax=Pseudofrankia sp. EUN1h TaxID=1834515 RepID=UPI001F51DF76|nr:nucleotide disphospho-sugar-binding domain-containing protein [Pseudofrankia sp. EUN1h]